MSEEKTVPPWEGENQVSEESAYAAVRLATDGGKVVVEKGVPISIAAEKAALIALRKFASGRGWLILDPITLMKPTYRRYIDKTSLEVTDEENLAHSRVRLDAITDMNDQEKGLIDPFRDALEALYDRYDLTGYAPQDEGWPIRNVEGKVVGRVIRVEQKGDRKRYFGQFRKDGAWFTPPVFPVDVWPFVLGDGDHHEDMIWVEGPKAMEAARNVRLRKDSWGAHFKRCTVIAHHAADEGIDHTDWTITAGRKVYLMVDTDEHGHKVGTAVAEAISKAGGIPILLRLPHYDKIKGKDIADKEYFKLLPDWQQDVEPKFRSAISPFLPRRRTKDNRPLPLRLSPAFVRNWVYVHSQDQFYSNTTWEHFKSDMLSSKFPGGKRATAAMVKAHEDFVDAYDITYQPGSPYGLLETGLFNVAKPHSFFYLEAAETEDLPPEFDRYMRASYPEDAAREAVLDYAAHAIAFPNEPPCRGVMVIGEEHGQGKSTNLTYLAGLSGRVETVTVDDIYGKFYSPVLLRATAAHIEEFYDKSSHEGRAIYNRSKSLTSPTISVNVKGVAQATIPNVVRVWATTNQPNALLMEKNDRRWVVANFHSNPEVWGEVESWLMANRALVYRVLKRRGLNRGKKVPTFAPLTEAKEAMISAGRSKEEVRLAAFIESLPRDACLLASDMEVEFKIPSHEIWRVMRDLGMTSIGQKKFPRVVREGTKRSFQPQFSVWAFRGWEPAKVKDIVETLSFPGRNGSRSYGMAIATRKTAPNSDAG